MRLVSHYKFIITFSSGEDTNCAKEYCDTNLIDFMYFPTPIEIDSGCGWCIGFNIKKTLEMACKNFTFEECYERNEKIWIKM